MPGTLYRDMIFVAPLYLPGRAYVLVASYYGEQGGWRCDDWTEHLEDLCEDGGTIFVDGLEGHDTIDLLWSDSDTMGAGHIVDTAERADYRYALEHCWAANQPVDDHEPYMAKADFLYEYCTTIEVDGGLGRDVIRGTPAAGYETETLFGGKDSDGIFGNGGDDVLRGGSGPDFIECGDTTMTCDAGGEEGDDRVIGNWGDDYLRGGDGSDFLEGRGGDDYLFGGAQNDFLFGFVGEDHLLGEGGNDILAGGLETDVFSGGTGTDTFWCRSSASADPYFDPSNADTDCAERPTFVGDRGMEVTQMADPYAQRVRRFDRTVSFGPDGNGQRYDVTFYTTTSLARLQQDEGAGATILYYDDDDPLTDDEPLHTHRIQSGNTCGPQSFEMVLRQLGYTDERPAPWQLLFTRDVTAYPGDPGSWVSLPAGSWDPRPTDYSTTPPTPGGPNEFDVSVEYGYSVEHIVLDALSQLWWTELASFPTTGSYDYLLPNHFELNNVDSWVGGDWLRVSYVIGDYDPLLDPPTSSPPGEGPLQVWDACSPGIGMDVEDEDAPWLGRQLAGVANRAADAAGRVPDAEVVSNEMIGTAAHFQAIVEGFLGHGIPLLVGVERGGHFNTIIGFWRHGSTFYVYTADPLDGYGRDWTIVPMRYQRFVLDQNLMDSHVLTGLLLFGHVSAHGCDPDEWADKIDDQPEFGPLLCD